MKDAVARGYLRALIGAPVGTDTVEATEEAFVREGRQWAHAAAVDYPALRALGVPTAVLDDAGIVRESSRERLRRFWTVEPFTVRQLARRAGCSEATVRHAIAAELAAGQLLEASPDGRARRYELPWGRA
jgi:hypothetical protein